jgi:hypothetical protein
MARFLVDVLRVAQELRPRAAAPVPAAIWSMLRRLIRLLMGVFDCFLPLILVSFQYDNIFKTVLSYNGFVKDDYKLFNAKVKEKTRYFERGV